MSETHPISFSGPFPTCAPSLSFCRDSHHFRSHPKLKPHSLLNFFLCYSTLRILQIYNVFIEPLEINRIQIPLPTKRLIFFSWITAFNQQSKLCQPLMIFGEDSSPLGFPVPSLTRFLLFQSSSSSAVILSCSYPPCYSLLIISPHGTR